MKNDSSVSDNIVLLSSSPSPFHRGEQGIQARVGKRDAMEQIGRRVIRPFMPDQHREFYAQLPFIVAGSVDQNGWPWASILPGRPGFISSPDSSTLDIKTTFVSGDPLTHAIKPGAPLGLLGIEMASRRRNRVNGHIDTTDKNSFSLKVDQSFGNCPQYIQSRAIEFIRDPNQKSANKQNINAFTTLDVNATTFINNADTFFVSSFLQNENSSDIESVDVSHRGGQSGFVKVEGNTLTIPDFSGNHYFNTLGNFLLNPKAGLVFPNFENGELLMLTGTVELLWEDHPEVIAFQGAERAWRFHLDHGLRLKEALPFRATFQHYSPNSLMNGNWEKATKRARANQKRQAWRPYQIKRIRNESATIRSFYLEPCDGDGLLLFKAGQFLTIKIKTPHSKNPLIRTYTVSSAPGETYYRISVKLEPHGKMSNYLHNELALGDIVEAKAPRGDFFIDTKKTRPAVLIAGGVGITPLLSMALHTAKEGRRTHHTRPLSLFYSAKTSDERAFSKQLTALEKETQGAIRYYSFISQAKEHEKVGTDFYRAGRINADTFRQTLTLDDYEFYICGPSTFMQAMYDHLISLGVNDQAIFAEAFGPAALTRINDKNNTNKLTNDKTDEADEALITFARSNVTHTWSKGDPTILEVAEAHGLNPDFGCRTGSCGSCAVKMNSGAVTYRSEPTATIKENEVLVCCATPAKGTSTLSIEL